MTLYVIRHAHAGSRSDWPYDDKLRPLSERGWAESHCIADQLTAACPTRLISSPLVRCRETFVPLSARLSLDIEDDDRLRPDTTESRIATLLPELTDTDLAICTHGEVMPMILDHLVRLGMQTDHELKWPKGSMWEVHGLGGSHGLCGRFHPRPPVPRSP